MAMKGKGPMAVGLMWMLTVIVLCFVALRTYTRLVVVKSYGMDDHVYALAFVLLALYTIFITLSAQYGFGQNVSDIRDPKDISLAILLEAIGQIFAVLGMAVAKWSQGLFLLRLVVKIRHQAAIWIVMLVLICASVSLIFCFMLQCSPPAYLWDRTIEGGHCDVPMLPVSIVYATACVFTDFFFALFPWIFIWGLQMNKREKLVILYSMSLGVIAGVFGVIRAVEIPSLTNPNYLRATVGIILWSAAEQCVTMVCIGIPVCRPLYRRYLGKLTSNNRSQSYSGHQKQSRRASGNHLGLRTFGTTNFLSRSPHGEVDDKVPLQKKHEFSSPYSSAYATPAASQARKGNASSEEEILPAGYLKHQPSQDRQRTINVDANDDDGEYIHQRRGTD